MVSEWPKISIVTPSYNQGQFLEQTILSVLEQGYPNLEYLIMDGGSTDNSVEIIRKYAHNLSYWVSERDQGQSDAINMGFRRATGDILAWINSDDYYLPGALQTAAEYFIEHRDAECIYADLWVVNANDDRLFIRKAIPYEYKMVLYGGCLVPQPGSFYRRQLVDRVGYLDVGLRYDMDLDFFIRCGRHSARFAHIPKPLAAFRLHTASKTQDIKRIAQTDRLIKARYAKLPFGSDRLNGLLLEALRRFYRAKGFVIRAITRGDLVPFRVAAATRKTAVRRS